MNEVVVDASAAIGWCFHDRMSPASVAAIARLRTGTVLVPAVFFFEVANALVVAQRRGVIAPADADSFVNLLESLRIVVDRQGIHRACHELREIATAQRLTVYDASYLQLAMRSAASIATRDGPLRDASLRVGLTLFNE